MEAIMKKIAFFIFMFFTLFTISDNILANTDSEYDTALQYYDSGQYEEAVRLFKDYVKKRPDPAAYYRIAYALYKLGRYDEATKYFKDAYLVDPLFSPVPVNWVHRYQKAKIKKITEPSR